MIDTGAWDALGEEGKAALLRRLSARNPARRIGTVEDIAGAVLFALTNTFLTGQTLHIDGGEPPDVTLPGTHRREVLPRRLMHVASDDLPRHRCCPG